ICLLEKELNLSDHYNMVKVNAAKGVLEIKDAIELKSGSE
ncbi:2364_t:CDS:1, partial [Entrophospora sp. SA101]